MPVVKLTKKIVEAQKWAGTTVLLRDTEVKGLMLSVNKTSATWKYQTDLWVDRIPKTIRRTLGTTEQYDLDEARCWARDMSNLVSRGVNPNEKKPVSEGPAAWTVGELWDRYEEHMRTDGGHAPGTIEGFRYTFTKYLSAEWKHLPLSELYKDTCREKHKAITRAGAPYPANTAMRYLRAAYNFAKKFDNDAALGENPVGGVFFNPERRRDKVILLEDLPAWGIKVRALPNPLRQRMHLFGLLSGLRPGTLVRIERAWVDLQAQRIRIPAASMKSGRPFVLPLSGPMVALLDDTLRLSRAMYASAPWLYPARSSGEVIATAVWKEKTMAGETGHILRKTWRTRAEAIGVPINHARALLDHRAPGIEAHYTIEAGLFAALLEHQERVSRHLLDAMGTAR